MPARHAGPLHRGSPRFAAEMVAAAAALIAGGQLASAQVAGVSAMPVVAPRAGAAVAGTGAFVGHGAAAVQAGLVLEQHRVGRIVHRVAEPNGVVVARPYAAVDAAPVRLRAAEQAAALAALPRADAQALAGALRAAGQRAATRPHVERIDAANGHLDLNLGAGLAEPSASATATAGPGAERRPGAYDTSEILHGRIGVNVVFISSRTTSRDFSTADREDAMADLVEAMDLWATSLPAAQLSFAYRSFHVEVNGAPIALGGELGARKVWIAEALSQALGRAVAPNDHYEAAYDLNRQARTALGTDWAYTVFFARGGQTMGDVWDVIWDGPDGIFLFSDGQTAFTMLGGPYMVMPYARIAGVHFWNPPILAHELGHVFYALDEYEDYHAEGHGHAERSGYFQVANGNLEDPAAPSDTDCIMRSSGSHVLDYVADHLLEAISFGLAPAWSYDICSYTRGQMGHRDTDADGVPDHADVAPQLTLAGRVQPGSFGRHWASVDGDAIVGARTNQNPYNRHVHPAGARRDLNLDTLTRVRYRVDGGAWRTVDGAAGGPGTALAIRIPLAIGATAATVEVEVTTAAGQVGSWRRSLRAPVRLPVATPVARAAPMATALVR